MKPLRFIKKVILFLLFSVLFYILGVIFYAEFLPKYFQKNIFYEKFSTGFSNTRFKEVKKTKNVDILFLGSSRSYRHYDPRIFKKAGFKSFNLGSSAQTFMQTEILVDRYLDALNPDFVVLDIYSIMFSSDGVETSLDIISNDYNSWDTFQLVIKTKNLMVLNTWIYAIYKEYIWDALEDEENEVKGVDYYIEGGYAARKVSTNSDNSRRMIRRWQYNENQWESFVNVIKKIKKSRAKLFIVHSPIHSNFKFKGNFRKLLNFLQSQNLKYYDYHHLQSLNDSLHFYNPSHLNQDGVDIYNDIIINDLFE